MKSTRLKLVTKHRVKSKDHMSVMSNETFQLLIN